MSELPPVPPGSVNLEDDEPPAPPQAVAPAEPATPPAEPPPPPDPDEAQAIEVQGGKMVPLAALKGARDDIKSAKEEAKALREQNAQLAQVLQTIQQVQRQVQPPPAPAQPTTDPLAESYARQLDYYKADGTLDLDRGAKAAQLFRQQAEAITREQMQPLVQHTAQTQAEANFQWVLNTPGANGVKPSLESVKQLWTILPAQYTSDRNVAQTLWTMAIGMDAATKKPGALPAAPAPPAHPPLVTEATNTVQTRQSKPLSEGTRLVLDARGMSEKKYHELTKTYEKGRASVLEDD